MNTLLVKCRKCGGNLYPENDTTLEIHCLQCGYIEYTTEPLKYVPMKNREIVHQKRRGIPGRSKRGYWHS